MKTKDITIVRIYTAEASSILKATLKYLHHDAKLRGVSVFRAIEGFGDSGERSATLVDLSMNLPVVIEFFDEPEKIEQILEYLTTVIKAEHIVYWKAQANA